MYFSTRARHCNVVQELSPLLMNGGGGVGPYCCKRGRIIFLYKSQTLHLCKSRFYSFVKEAGPELLCKARPCND
jgi:hypothetical protein